MSQGGRTPTYIKDGFVICDDGTMRVWLSDQKRWDKLPLIPTDEQYQETLPAVEAPVNMSPREAGFDGYELNVELPSIRYPSGIKLRLKRGCRLPEITSGRYQNQLLWYVPKGQEPKLLFCNSDNQLFSLSFTPYSSY